MLVEKGFKTWCHVVLFCVATQLGFFYYCRPKSKTTSAPGSVRNTPVPSDPVMDKLHDKITLANTISALEEDAQDDSYRTTIDSTVLPVGAEEIGSGLFWLVTSLLLL